MPEPEPSPAGPPDRTTGSKGSVCTHLRSPGGLRTWVDFVALAVLAFVPMLAAQPGVVTDDTKTYLYLDPGAQCAGRPQAGVEGAAPSGVPVGRPGGSGFEFRHEWSVV